MVSEEVIIGDCRLILGDCREVLPGVCGCHATITDPPYGVNLGKTKGEGGAHGLALEAYESYEDTYENYVLEVVPALTQSIQLTGRAAFFIGPHIHELPSLTHSEACFVRQLLAGTSGVLRTSSLFFCTEFTRICNKGRSTLRP